MQENKALRFLAILLSVMLTFSSATALKIQSECYEVYIESLQLIPGETTVEEWLATDGSREELTALLCTETINSADYMNFDSYFLSESILAALQQGKTFMRAEDGFMPPVCIDIFGEEFWFSFEYDPTTYYFLFAMSEAVYSPNTVGATLCKTYTLCYEVDSAAVRSVLADGSEAETASASDFTSEAPVTFTAQYERLVSYNETRPMFWIMDDHENADMARASLAAHIYGEFRYQEHILDSKQLIAAEHLYEAANQGYVYIGLEKIPSDDVYIYFFGSNNAAKITYTPDKGKVTVQFIDNMATKTDAESTVSSECQYYNEVEPSLLKMALMIYTNANGY